MLLPIAFLGVLATPALTFANDREAEEQHAQALAFLGGVHLGATLTALVPEPVTALASEGVAYASNLSLKALRPALLPPEDQAVFPNSADQCRYNFNLPQADHYYKNTYGLETSPVPDDWGPLGKPTLYHNNTEVVLGIQNSIIRPNVVPDLSVAFPQGNHVIRWDAQTILDTGFDVVIPAAMLYLSYSKFKAARMAPAAKADDTAKVAEEVGIFRKAGRWIADKLKLGIKKAPAKAADALINYVIDSNTQWETGTAKTSRLQTFTVYDVLDPVLTYSGVDQADEAQLPPITLEATDIGGVRRERVLDELLSNLNAYDPCDRSAGLSHNIPEFLSLGPQQVTYTATDRGPVAGAAFNNSVQAFQVINVADTQGPLLIPPPGKVVEVDPNGANASGLAAEAIDFGGPRVVDLADPAPRIGSDAPAFFPVNSRTAVTWTAEDASGNASAGTQLVTVKRLGENTAPTAANVSATTRTSEPVDIVLRGSDSDEIDGVFDPLALRLTSRPENGDFEAPLLPFFISDFRSSVTGPFPEAFAQAANPDDWMFDNVCDHPDYAALPADQRIPKDWAYKPRFIHVEDSGEYFLIDESWECDMIGRRASTDSRISKWSVDHELLFSGDYGGTTDTLVPDADGFLYQLSKSGQGTSTKLTLTQRFSSREQRDAAGGRSVGDDWRFDFASTDNPDTGVRDFLDIVKLVYARIDSERGLMYVSDQNRVFVFDVREDLNDGIYQSYNPRRSYLGALNNGEKFLCTRSSGSSNKGAGFAMDLDSKGNLYVMNGCDQRIHKFTPTTFNENNEIDFGEHVGWLGRCESSTNNACDVVNKRSRGYSCTNETCLLNDRNTGEDGLNRDGAVGTEPGQFNSMSFFDLDPNDILYVADVRRVQRFAPDGTFGGQAKSTGTGINQGDRSGFILGNLGSVRAVTVNSTRFYVVDVNESFVHEFETTPLKDITESSATVTYVSNFAFHGGVDTFTFEASDGLATSPPATVSVQVDRNYRPPEAFDLIKTVTEDDSFEFTLEGDDPDGVIGTDDVFPLDTLSYRIVSPPAHGQAEVVGDQLTYTPDPDFFGLDELRYVANDGRFDSPAATVALTVTPVDDRPVLSALAFEERVARGFPTVVNLNYQDDGQSAAPTYFVDWGDGVVDGPGDFVDPDGDGPQPATLEGTKLTEPPFGTGEGTLVADHRYTAAGNYTVEACVQTGPTTAFRACTQSLVQVQELVNLDIRYQFFEERTEGPALDFAIDIMNQPGQPPYFDALNVRVEEVVSDELEVIALTNDSGGQCQLSDGRLSCFAEQLPIAEVLFPRFSIAPKGAGPRIYDVEAPFAIEVTTTTPALKDVYTSVRWLTFFADTTDSDGDGMTDLFETTYGLNPSFSGDTGGDADGDGLSNLTEFEQRTNPAEADSDGDQIPDGIDRCPLDPNGSADYDQDGLCEAVQDLSPRERSRMLQLLQLLEALKED